MCGNHAAAVHTLLAHGADVNRRDADGWTSLMRAVENGCNEVAVALLALPHIETAPRNRNEQDCLDIAATGSVDRDTFFAILQCRPREERRRLVEIGLGLADKQLPLLVVYLIYVAACELPDHMPSMFVCWETLKLLKKRA